MAIEAGAKNGIFEVDEQTVAYVKERSDREFTIYQADADAVYDETYEIDLSQIKNRRNEDYVLKIKLDRKSSKMYRNIRALAKTKQGNE